MADDPIDPTQLGASAQPMPDLGAAQAAATPVLAGSPGSSQANKPPSPGRPALLDFISEMIKPSMQASAPGQIARPVSRVDSFENFLGNFVSALGSGMAASGHGPGSFGRGFGGAVQGSEQLAQQQYGQQQQAQAAQVQQQQEAAKTAQTQRQTELSGSQVTVPGPNGPVQMPYDIAAKSGYLKGMGAAEIAAKSKMSVEQMKFMIQQGQVDKVLDYKDPQSGEMGKMAYNKEGKPLGVLPGSLPSSAYLPKSTSTTQYMADADGNIRALPKKTTSGPVLPGSLGGPAKFPQGGAPTSRIPKPGAAAAPGGGGPPIVMAGPKSKDAVVAFNPQTGERELTDRATATSGGYEQMLPVKSGDVEKWRTSQVMFNDIQTNTSRYTSAANDALKTPPSTKDYVNMQALINKAGPFDLKVAVGAGGEVEIPGLSAFLEGMSRESKSEGYNALSPQSKALFDGYLRTLSTVPAYMKALTGIGRLNKETIDMELRNIPDPSMKPQDIQRKLSQWQENIDQGQGGIPKIKGLQTTKDVRQKYEGGSSDMVDVQIPGQAAGKIHSSQVAAFQKKYPAGRVLTK